MKTITFPVGYRPNYLKEFLDSLAKNNLEGWEIVCSVEKAPKCWDVLNNHPLDINIVAKPKSDGVISHLGARLNMYNALKTAFDAGTDFNLHLEDDFLLSPDALDLANWYYNNYKDKPLTYMSYGMFGFGKNRGNDYASLEEVPFFEGLGWCAFKENWEVCYRDAFFDGSLAKKYYGTTYGWDWNIQAYFRDHKCKAIRPVINRTQHNGRIGGTCCTTQHHDKHYVPLEWNQTERITEFKLKGTSNETEDWIK
jgi:hypothetical protein